MSRRKKFLEKKIASLFRVTMEEEMEEDPYRRRDNVAATISDSFYTDRENGLPRSMRVARPVGCNYGSGPDREKRPVHRLPITGRKGKGGFNLPPTSLHGEGRKRHGRVWHRLPIANREARKLCGIRVYRALLYICLVVILTRRSNVISPI